MCIKNHLRELVSKAYCDGFLGWGPRCCISYKLPGGMSLYCTLSSKVSVGGRIIWGTDSYALPPGILIQKV